MFSSIKDLDTERLISRILTLYYLEDRNQAEISQDLDLSVAKVNRLLKQARSLGWVEFNIHTPSQHLFELERQIEARSGVREAIVMPRLAENPESILATIGQVAANYLVEHLRDGDVICNGGGRGVAAMVGALDTTRKFDVQVVPALGGVQGRFDTDVNNLAAVLSSRLGGTSYQLYAPAFCDNEYERDAIRSLRQVKEVLDMACQAQVAVVGVGTLDPLSSSFLQFTSLSAPELQEITIAEAGVGEILAHVIDGEGKLCAPDYSNRVVGISLQDLRAIPLSIGIAALDNKAPAVAAALKGGYLKTIIMDDVTANAVLAYF
jgi:DNA-binding transcriptional regulator LsrR (DeoR family)